MEGIGTTIPLCGKDSPKNSVAEMQLVACALYRDEASDSGNNIHKFTQKGIFPIDNNNDSMPNAFHFFINFKCDVGKLNFGIHYSQH